MLKTFWLWSLLLLAPMLWAAPVLESLNASQSAQTTRIVLNFDQETGFRQFSLANPARIVIDLPNARPIDDLHSEALNLGAVRGVRVGYRSANLLRVVIDLRYAARARITRLAPQGQFGERLAVDIDNHPAGTMPQVVVDVAGVHTEPAARAYPQPIPQPVAPPAPRAMVPVVAKTSPRPPLFHIKPQPTPPAVAPPVAPPVAPVAPVGRAKPWARPVVVTIDPGHGGKDSGARNPQTGLMEKNVVLKIAKLVRDDLQKDPRFKVVMTRDRDIFIPLRERRMIARRAHADLFVSIHADSVRSKEPTGASVYILSTHGASSQLAKYLANSENSVDLKWGVDVSKYDSDIQEALINIQQEATLESSDVLAKKTLAALSQIGKLHRRRVERANFVVLRAPDIPSMLVETAFISNPDEARLLATPSYQAKIAQGIATGIQEYFTLYPPRAPHP